MANQQDSDHHNNDGGDDINNPVLTRAEFYEFCEETQQFHDETQQFCEISLQIIGEIQQQLATLLARKSFHNNNV